MFQAEWVDCKQIKGVVVNFLPNWWLQNYGFRWGERMFFDPDYRIDCDQNMRRILAERFPDLPLGDKNPTRRIVQPTLNNALTPAYYGCEIVFPDDKYCQWHQAKDYDQILTQSYVDIDDAFPFSQIIKQTAYMNKTLGLDEKPFIPPMGVLNNAIQLMGDRILGDLLDETSDADLFLETLAKHEIQKLTRNVLNGWHGAWYLFNCSVDLIGPMIYMNKILIHDISIAVQARAMKCGIHLHHCGRFDYYAQVYKQLGPIYSLEVGFSSDPTQAAEFPVDGGPLYIILDYHLMRFGSSEQVRTHVRGMVNQTQKAADRLVLLALDLEAGIPDDNIRTLFDVLQIAES